MKSYNYIDFLDYVDQKGLMNIGKRDYIKLEEIINAATAYVKLFNEMTMHLNMEDEDDRYTALNHIYAAGAYLAYGLNNSKSVSDSFLYLTFEDPLVLIDTVTDISRDGVDTITTMLEDIMNRWLDENASDDNWSDCLKCVMTGAFLQGLMDFRE